MQTIEIAILIIHIISLSICGGLVFSLLTSTNRDESSQLFAATCGAFTVWITFALVRSFTLALDITDVSFVQTNLKLLMSAIMVSGMLYFSFMVRYARIRGTVVDALNAGIVIITITGIMLLWFANVFSVQAESISQFTTSTIGFILVGFVIGYMLLSFWLMLNATTEQSSTLMRPTIMLFIVFVLVSLNIWIPTFGLDLLLLSVAAGMIGKTMLQRQLVNPQAALNRDLQLTNQELQRTIHDLAQEKEKTEALNVELIQANRYKDEFFINNEP